MLLPSSDGTSKISHLLIAEKDLKKIGKPPPAELQAYYDLECPDELKDYYDDFLQISKRRGVTESGPSPITWVDIHAWASVCKIELTQLQIDMISMLDELWLSVYRKKNQPKKSKAA